MDILSKVFIVFGLALDLIGAVILASTLSVSKEEAVEKGVIRLAGNTFEENLGLTAVQTLLKESKIAKYGVIILAVGFLGQIVGILIN